MLTLDLQVKAICFGECLPGEDYSTIYTAVYDPAASSMGLIADVVENDIELSDPDRGMRMRLFSFPVGCGLYVAKRVVLAADDGLEGLIGEHATTLFSLYPKVGHSFSGAFGVISPWRAVIIWKDDAPSDLIAYLTACPFIKGFAPRGG